MLMMMLMMIDDVDDDVNFTLNLHRIDYIIPCYNTSQHRFDDTLKVVLLSCYIPMKLGNLQCIQRPRRKYISLYTPLHSGVLPPPFLGDTLLWISLIT